MSSQFYRFAAILAAGAACIGCGGALKCGNGCGAKSPYAGMNYDCACETCGPTWCAKCGDECSCGDRVNCGDQCACGGSGCAACGGAGCNACGGRGCANCGSGCSLYRNAWCYGYGPLPILRRLGSFLDCAGCGECYWNEWYNDPPACAEPCDCYGNWVGPGHPGYYRAPYEMPHGWISQRDAVRTAEEAPLEQTPSSLAALDAAAETAAQVETSDAAETAVYDDSALNPELQ